MGKFLRSSNQLSRYEKLLKWLEMGRLPYVGLYIIGLEDLISIGFRVYFRVHKTPSNLPGDPSMTDA